MTLSASVATAVNLIGGELQTILLKNGRNIGGIIPNVVISERHSDDLTITDHPVEQGAQISDHAYKMPAEVVMQCGWSPSHGGVIEQLITDFKTLTGQGESIADTYKKLLELQESRLPFELVTGKRLYKDMLIKRLEVNTDASTENILSVTCTMRQILIVSTQTTTLAAAPAHADASKTSAPSNTGVKQPVKKAVSVLKQVAGTIFGG